MSAKIDKRLLYNTPCLRESLEPRLPGFLCWLLCLAAPSMALSVFFNKYTLDTSCLPCIGPGNKDLSEQIKRTLALEPGCLAARLGG